MGYKIDFFCAPDTLSHVFIPEFVNTLGVGAAELHLIDLARQLALRGHSVTVYNSCPASGIYDNVTYCDADEFIPQEPHGVFILHRNPSQLLPYVNAKVRIFESDDQQTSGDYRDIYPHVDAITAISPYHKNYLVERYGFDPNKIYSFDIGVRINEYLQPVEKIPYRCIYTSTPSRGLKHLAKIFPAIRFIFPQAELYITAPSWGFGLETQYHPDTKLFEGMEGVYFLGKLPREQLVELQLSADLHLYPNDDDGTFLELFCLSVAESQVAGTPVVTTQQGGLATTVMPPSRFVKGTPKDDTYANLFVEQVVELLADRRKLEQQQKELSVKARQRFNWERIGRQWIRLIESLMPESPQTIFV